MQVTINLNWNSSNHTYSLTSSNEKLCQISSDKQSYIIFGKTYTPIIQYDGGYVQRYRLVSYSFASASNVGVSSRSGTTSGSPNTTSNYSSSEVNYYTRHSTPSTYDYETMSISLNGSTGEVSGDTSYCSWELNRESELVITGWQPIGDYEWDADVDVLPNKQLSTVTSRIATLNGLAGEELFTPHWTDSAIVGPGGDNTYLVESATAKTYYWADGASRYSPRSRSATISNGRSHISASYRREDAIYDTEYSYTFKSVTWDSSISYNGYSWSKYGSASTSDYKSSQEYRRLVSSGSTWYDPDFYSSFTFNATTGNISWSHRGGSTSYYNRVEQYSSFNIEDASYYQYNITSLDWNYEGDEYGLCTIIEQTTSHMIIDIPDVGWVFIDESTGERKEGQLIKFIDETTGTETMIKKVQASNNGILSRYLRTTTKKK